VVFRGFFVHRLHIALMGLQTVFIVGHLLYLSKIYGEGMKGDKRYSLLKIRSIADYQFGKGVGVRLFPDNVEITYSKRTGRIRHVYLDGKLLATLRPSDGFFSLTVAGAKRMVEKVKPLRCWVTVSDEAAPFVAEGKSLFAKHVVDADEDIRPHEEVLVTDRGGEILAVGRALLTGREMKAFRRGIAVKVRRGVKEES